MGRHTRAARAAAGIAAGCWAAAAYVAGRLARWTPARWESRGGRRVLVVAPHPDDEVGCGGALLLHHRAGDTVHVVYATDGRGSRAGGLGPDEMAARRRREAAAAAHALGVGEGETHWLGLREWEWENAALESALRDLLHGTRPDVVYAPSGVDFHPEHVRVAACVAAALAHHESRDLVVRAYQIQVPFTPVLVNLVAPIAPVAEELFAALREYRTQLPSIERCRRMKRYAAVLYGVPAYAEEFWQLDAAAYGRVHAGGAAAGAGFRGVRRWPFSDPLSYVRGLAARRRMRRAADQARTPEVAA